MLTHKEILELRKQFIGPSLSISYREPLHIVRGEGQYLFDDHGNRYLDAVNNISHVGHCHPMVIAAAEKQTRLLNTNTRYLHDSIVHYAQDLTGTFPDGPDHNVLKIKPPMVFTKDNALELAETLDKVLNQDNFRID